MFGIERLIGNLLEQWINKGGWTVEGVKRFKIVFSGYLLAHLISVGLVSWMLYRLLFQKQKDKWSLIIPISGLIISLFIPYGFKGWEGGDSSLWGEMYSFARFFAFASLFISIISIALYFFNIQFTKKEEGEEKENKNE